eukprot:COSAG01_NODE_16379_length_1234_cov_1.216287_1_plen_139_part_00
MSHLFLSRNTEDGNAWTGRLVTSHAAIPCAEGIDWDAISLQYELTGGFIKNAVISALLAAVGRDSAQPLITQKDIVAGCRKQMRGALQMLEFEQRVIPRHGLAGSAEEGEGGGLICSDVVRAQLQQMVRAGCCVLLLL